MAKIVVTGSQGFLGRHVTKRLVDLGEDVCATYNYTHPNLPPKHNRNYFKADITNFSDCLKLINQENPKILFHFVAQPVVTAAMRHPFSTFELTIRGAYNLLESVRQAGDPELIIVYTSDKVYGENLNAKEVDRLDTVKEPYEVAKTCEDLISRSYAKIFGLPIIIIRSGNLYGEGDTHWNRLVPGTCKDICLNKSPVLRSNGLQKRDYIYVDDAVDGCVSIMDAFFDGKLSKGDAVNLGSNESYSALDIVNSLLKVSQSNLEPTIMNTAKNEIEHQHINFDLAKSLGWSPKTILQVGLEKTFQWYRDWFSS